MEKPYVVGIDIGGTNTVFGVVDARGTILYSGSIKTGKYVDIDEYVTALGEGLKGIIDQAGGPDKIKGIGVGAPNGNFFNGCIEFAPNLPWKGVIPLALSAAIWFTDTTVSPVNWATSSFVGTTDAFAVAAATVAWRLMLLRRVLPAQPANIWKSARTTACCASSTRMKSLLRTFTTQR